jgi:hypothetical protein
VYSAISRARWMGWRSVATPASGAAWSDCWSDSWLDQGSELGVPTPAAVVCPLLNPGATPDGAAVEPGSTGERAAAAWRTARLRTASAGMWCSCPPGPSAMRDGRRPFRSHRRMVFGCTPSRWAASAIVYSPSDSWSNLWSDSWWNPGGTTESDDGATAGVTIAVPPSPRVNGRVPVQMRGRVAAASPWQWLVTDAQMLRFAGGRRMVVPADARGAERGRGREIPSEAVGGR